jgi:hypothetical protein
MRILLVAMVVVVTVGFVYFNDYQHEMMMESMEADAPDPRLEALASELRAVDTVFVLITDESQRAFHDAVVANPGKSVHELGVSTEDRLHAIEVASPDGRATLTVPALVVFTREEAVWNETSFRTDSPVYVLDYVRTHPEIDYLLLNPPPGITASVPDSAIVGPSDVAALYWRLQ